MDTPNSSAVTLVGDDLQQMWDLLNDTSTDQPSTTLATRFLDRLRRHPNHIAVTSAQRTLTYQQLAEFAGAVAVKLSALCPEGTVAICVEPGCEHVVAVMGALLAGVPFHPVPEGASQSLVQRRFRDTETRAVLTGCDDTDHQRWPRNVALVALDELPPGPPEAPVGALTPESVACLLAVGAEQTLAAITHDALLCTIAGLADRYGLDERDRLLAIGAVSDEVSLSSILCPLLTGGTVVIVDDVGIPAGWLAQMRRDQVTVWHSTPTRTALLVEQLLLNGDPPPSLRLALLGGEPLALTLVERLRRLVGPKLRVVHLGMYAPAGLWITAHEPGAPDPRQGHTPIGAPMANKQVYILTDAMTLCPVWVAGRIYVCGRGLAGKDSSTTGPVAAHPSTGAPMHRTAMTGRLLPDATIELIGDDATRISVHGHPLNLYDVQGSLATHPDVLIACTVPLCEGSAAFIKTVPESPLTGAELLDHLRGRMSPYLLPTHVELMQNPPVTISGRVDRTALAVRADTLTTEPPAVTVSAAEALTNDVTVRACGLAAQILGVAHVEPSANLLDLGATSVEIVRLALRAEDELGIAVDVDQLLAVPTVAVLVSSASSRSVPSDDPSSPPWARGLILDPVERMAFKDRQLGIRRDLSSSPQVVLSGSVGPTDRLLERRTRRKFSDTPVTAGQLGSLLVVLRRFAGDDGEPKYTYPSAGSLYPVQVYLTVVAGRVSGIPPGAHYYHRGEHHLVSLATDTAIPASAHAWINRDTFRSAGFAVYLVADHSAIEPLYGQRARDYCLVEAGAMCQLLMSTAADLGVGLCPIGEMDDTAVRDVLRLNEHHEVMHILLGGAEPAPRPAVQSQADMLRRVQGLRSTPSGLT